MKKSELKTFENKRFLMFITLPIKFKDNKKVNSIIKKYKEEQVVFVYSKDLKKTILYHCFFDPAAFILGTWNAENVEFNSNRNLPDMFVELYKIIDPNSKITGVKSLDTYKNKTSL